MMVELSDALPFLNYKTKLALKLFGGINQEGNLHFIVGPLEKHLAFPINEPFCPSSLQSTYDSFIELLCFIIVKKNSVSDDVFAFIVLRSKSLHFMRQALSKTTHVPQYLSLALHIHCLPISQFITEYHKCHSDLLSPDVPSPQQKQTKIKRFFLEFFFKFDFYSSSWRSRAGTRYTCDPGL